MAESGSLAFRTLKYIGNDVYTLRQTTKLAMIYDSQDQQTILKCYLPARIQTGNTVMRTVMPINSALEGYQLVREKLPAESVLLDASQEDRYLLLRRIEGAMLPQFFPLSANIIGRILNQLQTWDRAGLFHNTLTPENILITPEENVAFVDFDDVFLSDKLLHPTSNLYSFFVHTVHSLALDERISTEDKLAFIQRFCQEFGALSWEQLQPLQTILAEKSSKVLGAFQFAGGLLKLVFEAASGWLLGPSVRARAKAVLESLNTPDFDLNLAVDYFSLFLSLDAHLDDHKRGLLNPLALLNRTPLVLVICSASDLQNSTLVNRVFENLPRKGLTMIFSDWSSSLNLPLTENTTNLDLVYTCMGHDYHLARPLILLFNAPYLEVAGLSQITFNQRIDSAFCWQVITATQNRSGA
jgi:hypothetical protein